MPRPEHEELVQRLLAAWNAHDPDAIAACYAPDVTARDVTLSEQLAGRAAVRLTAVMYLRAFPDVHFELERVISDGDMVCEQWRANGTHRGDLMGLAPTGRQVGTSGCNVMRVGHDGLIREETTYWDATQMYRQLGALPQLARSAVG